MLKVIVKAARNLPNVDFIGKSDPYVKLSFQGEEKKTKDIQDNLNPDWTEDNEFEWDLGGHFLKPDETLNIKVKDQGPWPRKLLGQVTVELMELLKTKDNVLDQDWPLVDSHDRATLGTISLRIEYSPPGGVTEIVREDPELAYLSISEEEEGEVEGRKTDGPHRKKRRRPREYHPPRQWSTKVQDYQIRIKVLEGRQLPGTNINPLVRVNVRNKKQETSVKRSTNSPTFNQTFFFNFKESEAELFDQLITLEVYNSRRIRTDALLGYFESEIGTVHEMPGHAFVRKWVLLTGTGVAVSDDEENEGKKSRGRGRDGGPAGYLKLTVMVLGPGDEPPHSSRHEPSDSTEEDIESNLLIPRGVSRHLAVFNLKIFLAEDLPQMDSGITRKFKRWFLPGPSRESALDKRKSVDPYLVISFSGKEVKTKEFHNENNPVFNQQLKLPVMFPSMCERIKLQLWDWDRGSKHDCIATAYLSLPEISGQNYGEEFFPRYGPCYLNFYGSPREFKLFDEHEDLNRGVGQGVAYRGRVLIELNTDDPSNMSHPVTDLDDDDAFYVRPYLRQERFKLFACFYEAAMVSKSSAPIEFEVSIGNFGNTLDETVASCNTPPTNPMYDGCYYHYLPWFDQKPCICLDCNWENVAFRIEPLNVLSNLCERLESSFAVAKDKIRGLEEKEDEERDSQGAGVVHAFLQEMVIECSTTKAFFKEKLKYLPGSRNKLDVNLWKLRTTELQTLIEDASENIKKLHGEDSDPFGETISVENLLLEIDNYILRLHGLLFEPQNSMPDVIIWMLSGGNRIAYHRVPAKDVLYSSNKNAIGKWCGKPVELELKYPGKKAQDVKERPELPGLVRVELWLGLRSDQDQWALRENKEGEFAIFAEMYENEVKVINWKSSGFGTRPNYSNASGEVELGPDKFVAPRGWHFESQEWIKSVDKSAMYARDWGLKMFVEEIYEHQSRNIIGGGWGESTWKDGFGESCQSPAKLPAPEGWRWKSDRWEVDVNRAVDSEGWEYSVGEEIGGIYSKAQMGYHRIRRRRWVRTRELVDPKLAHKRHKIEHLMEEGWEYAQTFLRKFHIKPHGFDRVRRKRLLKKLVPNGERLPELPPKLALQLKVKGKKKTTKKKADQDTEKLVIDTEEEGRLPLAPRMFVEFKKSHKFQLWVYLYEARDLLGMDDSGMSDPYVRVSFLNQSQKSEVQTQTISPTWNQTLVFPQVELYDTEHNIRRHPPSVVMEVFDKDPVGRDDFIGRFLVKPVVQVVGSYKTPPLTWSTVNRGERKGGEVLAACELFLEGDQKIPSRPTPKNPKADPSDFIWPVRDGVRPQLRRVAVEIFCWGVRNFNKYRGTDVNSPVVEFEWGNTKFESDVIENANRNPNFAKPHLTRQIVVIPVEPYTPALSIRVFDKRAFRYKPLIGVHSLTSLKKYERSLDDIGEGTEQLLSPSSPLSPQIRQRKSSGAKKDEEFDWWSKYYYSLKHQTREAKLARRIKRDTGEDLLGQLMKQFSSDDGSSGDHLDNYDKTGYDTLTIFPKELEKMPGYENLEDFVSTFTIKRGKARGDDEDEGGRVGELKASFRVYPLSDTTRSQDLPSQLYDSVPEVNRKWPLKCLVRVYAICAIDLQPQDTNGLADPYLVISVGKKEKFNDRKKYKKNNLNPVFGRMYEFNTTIPLAKDLRIAVMDHDVGTADDLIGETTVDLEQRLISRYHASCGLAGTYYKTGPFAWRDNKTPKEILRELCKARKLQGPTFYYQGNTPVLVVGTESWSLDNLDVFSEQTSKELGSPEQRLALLALHSLGLVPEHVETRPLYSPLQPRIEQGKLQMWIDIFPSGEGFIKPPVDIEPRKPQEFVLRVVIWDTTSVVLQETSIAGEKMSDIYVKGWMEEINEKQKTDVHYRSLDGDGNFNWRMEFPFSFMTIEKLLVVSKEKFWKSTVERKVEPKLKIQIWENDKFSPDDFLGTRTLDLHHLPKPCSNARWCGTKYDPGVRKDEEKDFVDLFTTRSIRGWWACWATDNPTGKIKGKVDMTIEILSAEEAKKHPVGLGRNEPNQHPYLSEPNRPSTSFLWFLSPFKTVRYIVWRNYKWYIIGFIIFVLLVVAIVLFIYNVPGLTARKMMEV